MSTPIGEYVRRKLNIVEAIIIAGLVGVGAMFFTMRDALIELRVQTDQTNKTLGQIQAQLNDIPAIRQSIAEMRVQVDQSKDDIKELRTMRGLH